MAMHKTVTAGELKVFMDVDIAEAVEMDVDQLKERLHIVEEMEGKIEHLVEDNEKKNETIKELNRHLESLEERYQKREEIINNMEERYQKSELNILAMMGKIEALTERSRERADDEVDEPDEEEPVIALEDQLRITEQSAKAIDLLTNHLLSTVWLTCSKNTFGKCMDISIRTLSCSQ
jgi:sugar-specific transcriptional regulator TrmB